MRSNTSHAYSGSSVARYRAELGDTNQSLSCTVTQEAEDGRLHFSKTLLYKLEVSPAPPAPAPRHLVREVTVVAGLGAGAGLLLLAALLTLALCRHSGEQEKEQQLHIAADLRGG